jgi:hypothetical protein
MHASIWDLKQINDHLSEYELNRHKSKLLFEDVQLILTELGFLHSGGRHIMKKDPTIDINKERDLLDDLWLHMKGDYYANIENLKTFIYGMLGLKYPWMLNKPEIENIDSISNRSSAERISPAMRLLGTQFLDCAKQTATHKTKHGSRANLANKGFYTLNLFNTSPMRTSISKALQNFKEDKNALKSHKSPNKGSISSKLGDNVGNFDSEGIFKFKKKVEIRKMNMHYKLLSDNRAKYVRQKKMDSTIKKSEMNVIIKPKVDHRKYLKPPKPYEPKEIINVDDSEPETQTFAEENQGQSLKEGSKKNSPKHKFVDLEE